LEIIAHRGNVAGPSAQENTLDAYRRAIDLGFGIEFDVRADERGRLYISHDRGPSRLGLSAGASVLLSGHAPLAVNVKDRVAADAPELYALQRDYLGLAFLFDFELLELAAPDLRSCAVRVSDLPAERPDRRTSLAGRVVWLDEMMGPWVTPVDVAELRSAGAAHIAYVAPDLHGREVPDWDPVLALQADSVCTDYGIELESHVRRLQQ
jgi:hypothetical protein